MARVGEIYRKKLLDNVKDGVQQNNATVLLSYSDQSAAVMDDLRKNVKTAGGRVYVSKNRIAKLALKEIEQADLACEVERQSAFVFSNEDSVALTKALVDFVKDKEQIVIKGGLLDGRLLVEEDIQRLSELPPKEALQAQLLATIVSPLTRLAGAMNAKSRDLLSILKQYGEKKGGS